MIKQSRYRLVINAIDEHWTKRGHAPTTSQIATMTGLTHFAVQEVLIGFGDVIPNYAVESSDEDDTKEFEPVQLIDEGELETKEYPAVKLNGYDDD